ncbi:hypothetical protein JCM9279_006092 [Rhodotorula babjevae]
MSSAAQPEEPPAAAPTAAAPAALSSSPTTDVVTEPSSPPPHPQPDPVHQSQPHSTLQRPHDPKVAQLKALFPDLEDSVLEAVLDGTGGSLDEATEQLLMMSDPDFKTDTTQLSQLEADEELARQLAREDELEQAQQRINAPHRSARSSTSHQQQQQAPSQPRPLSYQAYVPKSRRGAGGGGGPASPSLSSWEPPAEQSSAPRQEQGPQRDELQELTEQFNKVADTGKRMFGNFLSKAKEQMNRLDDAIVRSASPPSTSTPSTAASAPAPPPKPAHPAPARTSSTSSWTAPSPLPRPPPPRNLSSDGPPPVVMIDRTGLAGGGAGGHEKKDDEPAAAGAAASASASVSAGGLAAPGSVASTDSPKKDFSSKIPGLLPRQSFSLLDAKAGPKSPSAEDKGAPTSASTSTSASAANATPAAAGLAAGAGAGAGAALGAGGAPMASPLSAPNHALGDDDDESDDDLEYTRSPFDDD